MERYIEPPTIGEVLLEEFMKPLGLSAYRVAKDIRVPVSRIQEILNNKRGITADTDARFAKYFGMSEGFFLGLQMDFDLMAIKHSKRLQQDLELIPCITKDRIVSVE